MNPEKCMELKQLKESYEFLQAKADQFLDRYHELREEIQNECEHKRVKKEIHDYCYGRPDITYNCLACKKSMRMFDDDLDLRNVIKDDEE